MYYVVLFLIGLMGTNGMAIEKQNTTAVNIIPKPQYVEQRQGWFKFDAQTQIVAENEVVAVAEYLAAKFGPAMKFPLPINSQPHPSENVIHLGLKKNSSENEEAYELEITPKFIQIRARGKAGLFYGVQSLRQLLPPEIEKTEHEQEEWKVPCLFIRDHPRFRWRGLLLDCCRHFMEVSFVKRMIDLLALYKMNVLHWHLTEDQGWRIEIKKYPRLTEIGAWRTYDDDSVYGGFYNQEQIRDVVAYAQERQVTVVPEIEMPGHALAALSAYPQFSCTGGPFKVETQWGVFQDVYCAGNDSTFEFLEDVLSEVMMLFPSPYIHIGGDEVPKTRWQQCSKCQARIRQEKLKNEHELQSYFIKRIESFLRENNRHLIGWDEILEGGLAPEATVQSWRGMEGAIAAARSGHNAIVSPVTHAYFDYPVQTIDLRRVFSFEPVPNELTENERKFIIGGECNIWTEHAPQEVVDRKVFPRLLAMAERLWSSADNRDYQAFLNRVRHHYRILNYLGVSFGAESKPVTILPTFQPSLRQYTVQLQAGEEKVQIRYTMDGSEPTIHSPVYEKPFVITRDLKLKARGFREDLPYGEVVEKSFQFHLAVGKKISYKKPYSPKYPAMGPGSLVDGMTGSNTFRDGFWQGFESVDFEAVVDLGKVMPVQAIECNFLQDVHSWIWLPLEIRYAISEDGKKFTEVAYITHDVPQKVQDPIVKSFREVLLNTHARFISVFAKNIDKCPPWHPGAGGKAWIFVDEIKVE